MKLELKSNLGPGLVVFLVALPLCLGIALASDAPPLAGLIAGMIGGIVISYLSGSRLSVSGPAAGLAVIVADAIVRLGSYEVFLLAVVLAGLIQLVMGFLKAGKIAHFFPNSVIKGMLAAIGIVIALKQIPHALGRDTDWEGDMEFFQFMDGENTFTEIARAVVSMSPGALLISVLSIIILIVWTRPGLRKYGFFRMVPGPLVVVLVGIALNELFGQIMPSWELTGKGGHLVQIPVVDNALNLIRTPDWSSFGNSEVYVVAATVALIASIETLLCIEATDKLDPEKRVSDTDRELKAQGIGNMLSGLLGGLPVTSVIVRSSANIYSGATARSSSFIHGVLLVGTVLLIPEVLNMIPLAALAAVLINIGVKLANPVLFKELYKQGPGQFIPFIITIIAIVFTDLLIGIGIGLAVGLIYVIRTNFHSAIQMEKKSEREFEMIFRKDISFLNKYVIKQALSSVPHNSRLVINGEKAKFIDQDIYDIIRDFEQAAGQHNVQVEYVNMSSESIRLLDIGEERKIPRI